MRLATTVTVLLLHGGGFDGGEPASVQPLANDLRSAGYTTIAVPYRDRNPNGNVLGEIATVRRYAQAAERRGPVVAYGVSAGGTLASALAARGEVDGAVNAGGPTNLLTWIGLAPIPTNLYWRRLGMDRGARREASPYYRLNGRQSPQLLLYGDIDPIVLVTQGLDYNRVAAKDQPDTTLVLMSLSPHAFWGGYRAMAREWIQARWRVVPRSGSAGHAAQAKKAGMHTAVVPELWMESHDDERILLRRDGVPVH
jgi:acetyl esterase/lipase